MLPIRLSTPICLNWLGALALCASAAGAAAAQHYEQPPAYSPTAALGAAARGANYVVLSPVVSDGALRHYTVKTSYGDFQAVGDQLMLARIKELNALNELEKTNGAQKFGEASVKAALGPLVFAGNLVAHPVETTQGTFAGVGQFFNGIGSGLNNMGKSRDDTIASLTGASTQKRLIAAQFGVDPYTDFKPLADKLDNLAGAAVVGNLAVSGALIAVPGVAGAVASNASTVSALPGMASDYSAAQLMDMNREKLGKLGVNSAIADQLFANQNYTPVDVTAMVEALSTMGEVKDLEAMVARAATADSREAAFFIRRRIELTADYGRQTGNIAAFVGADNLRYPLCLTAVGGIVGVFPIDSLSWTPETASAVETMTSEAKGNAATGAKTLVITGTATPLARRKLRARGWTLRTNDKLR